MSHFGIISSPVPGHLNPLCTLGRELIRRDHKVTAFSLVDTQKKIENEGLNFCAIGELDFPLGAWEREWLPLSEKSGLAVVRGTVRLHTRLADMMCRDVPPAAAKLGIDVLLVDQIQFQGRAIAERLKIPFVSVACALLMNRDEDRVSPPPFAGWQPSPENLAKKYLNTLSWTVFDRLAAPVVASGARAARSWGQSVYTTAEETFSPYLQLIPMAESFDFAAPAKAKKIRYMGSFVDSRPHDLEPFPFSQLSAKKPLIYASFGTLQTGNDKLYATVLEACATLDAQLVLSLGDWRGQRKTLPAAKNAIVVQHAPQLELLKRASVCITHGGANTVNECLTYGVPMVVIPITNDQPAMAARVTYAGVGRTIPFRRVNSNRLRETLEKVRTNPMYRIRAQTLSQEITSAGGVARAAELIEDTLRGHLR